ncbi:SDR family NAD(P)-dependent oxidoreductase [Lentibacillus amyloliquefaciens]|uniref:Oxidoreductase n=1 Tax=Lentibacillus amyloliquefaciens TaxID=1472767 RepID=A0A0U4G9R5_9BACI|nr:SDR family oxidoreductase [Lentibacillus amyloliquefaciens]ALX49482.1 oxidoreductase [Lentibacillus amyloliquefaciens]
MRLKDKVVVITGGAGGIGSGMARAVAKEGAKVAIVDVNDQNGVKVEVELKEISDAVFMNMDISNPDNARVIKEKVLETFGRIDVLINNAHVSKQASFAETTQDMLDLSFNTGFYPTFYLMKACFDELKKTKGSVINFASGAGLEGQINQTSYAAAKEAIRGISRTAANEWGKDGINVNLISPIALTEGVKGWRQNFPNQYEEMVDKIPLGRLGDPEEDIGRVAVFLASDDSKYMTGQTLMVDGGSIKLR